MKDKLEVGMYVRTKNNPYIPSEIAQIIKMDDKYIYLDIDKDSNVVWEYPEYIKKASHNIIDLIEAGDYVNGWKVLYWTDGTKIIDDGYASDLNKIKIKSIVTKEQFVQMAYKVGE